MPFGGEGKVRIGMPRQTKAAMTSVPSFTLLRGARPLLDTESRAANKPRLGHNFSKLRVHADGRPIESERVVNALAYTMHRDVGFGVGQLGPGTTRQSPTLGTQKVPDTQPTDDTAPTPLDKSPTQGPAIAVTNGWANPAGKQDRTTVGIGELNSFVVNDVAGGSWKSADGTGTTVNSVTFRWTASVAGTNDITYTAADNSTSTVPMTTAV